MVGDMGDTAGRDVYTDDSGKLTNEDFLQNISKKRLLGEIVAHHRNGAAKEKITSLGGALSKIEALLDSGGIGYQKIEVRVFGADSLTFDTPETTYREGKVEPKENNLGEEGYGSKTISKDEARNGKNWGKDGTKMEAVDVYEAVKKHLTAAVEKNKNNPPEEKVSPDAGATKATKSPEQTPS